jgi:hypothetical protein
METAASKFKPYNMDNQNSRKIFGRFSNWCSCAVVSVLALTLAGCSSIRSQPHNNALPQQLIATTTGPVTSSVLQLQVMRFADIYVAMISQACDDIAAATTNSDIRLAALRWKLQQATAAYNNATGQNPSVDALDMLVLVTMSRNVVQDYYVPKYGEAVVRPLLNAHISMETNAWGMAEGFLAPSQEIELKNLIQEWRRKNPYQTEVGPIRFREFAIALGAAPPQARTRPSSIFSLLYLNPLAGLDPTTAAIEGMRQLGERTIYYTQRLPTLLNWQTQLLVYQLAGQPESAQLLANINQFATTAAILSDTAKQLPQVIKDQREAAIQQILDGLIYQEDKSSQILTNARLTLYATADAATNLNAAILSLNDFVRYVSPTNTTTSSGTNSVPFNVLDYGTAASQIGTAANNLNTLLTTMNQSTPQMNKLSQQIIANANLVVSHAFWLALALIIILLAGSVIAALTYRVIASKLAAGGRQTPEPKP